MGITTQSKVPPKYSVHPHRSPGSNWAASDTGDTCLGLKEQDLLGLLSLSHSAYGV